MSAYNIRGACKTNLGIEKYRSISVMSRFRSFTYLLLGMAIVVGAIFLLDIAFGRWGSSGQIIEEPVVALDEPSQAPELAGITAWINSQPLELGDLRGKVVLVDFWTYGCANCVRTFPHLSSLHANYADDGLVILGVHTPEYKFEKKIENVREAVKVHGLRWPVALDNDYATWKAYGNHYWPAQYLIDKDGLIRYTHVGEGAYVEIESKLRDLLAEAGAELSAADLGLDVIAYAFDQMSR